MWLINAGDSKMMWRFDREALLIALLVFITEVLIATVWSHHRFLRSFGGDALAVVWLYWVFKTVIRGSVIELTAIAFAVGCVVELGQYVASTQHWYIGNRALRIVLGSVADWNDVLAYAVGAVAILLCAGFREGRISWGPKKWAIGN